MTRSRDFLDEIVGERSATNPAFAGMVEEAYERRVASRARGRAPEGTAAPEPSGRSDRQEADERP